MRIGLPLICLAMALAGCSREPETTAKQPEGEMIVPTKGGAPVDSSALMSATDLAKAADIPLYPKAELPSGKSNLRKDDKQTRYEVVMVSTDPSDKILAFYRAKLEHVSDAKDQVMGTTKKGQYVIVKTTTEKGKTNIVGVSISMK